MPKKVEINSTVFQPLTRKSIQSERALLREEQQNKRNREKEAKRVSAIKEAILSIKQQFEQNTKFQYEFRNQIQKLNSPPIGLYWSELVVNAPNFLTGSLQELVYVTDKGPTGYKVVPSRGGNRYEKAERELLEMSDGWLLADERISELFPRSLFKDANALVRKVEKIIKKVSSANRT